MRTYDHDLLSLKSMRSSLSYWNRTSGWWWRSAACRSAGSCTRRRGRRTIGVSCVSGGNELESDVDTVVLSSSTIAVRTSWRFILLS